MSALELMTTASALSLAQGIIHGKKDVEDAQAETDNAGPEDALLVVQQHVRRTPSVFASALEDHFPPGAGVETSIAEDPVIR